MFRSEQVSITSLTDTSKVADWAVIPEKYKTPVSTCYSMGVLSGIDEAGNFNGEGFMTRAQAAAVLSRMMKVAPDHVDTLRAA